MGPFNGGESVLRGFYSGDLVRLMYQLSSYYFYFCLLFEIFTMYFYVNSPCMLQSSNWSCVLTQEYVHIIDGKEVKILHPITYMSGLFKGSQISWACLTKEAYDIYIYIYIYICMSSKKLPFYLEDADVVLRSDHLPL